MIKEEKITKELLEEALPLLEEHAKELNVLSVTLDPDYNAYLSAAEAGYIALYTTRDDEGKLIGYALYWVNMHPHYSILVATQDVLFLHKDHRKGRLGIKLLKYSEKKLKEDYNVKVIVQHTKKHKALDSLFSYLGYTEAEAVYLKEI